MYFSFCNIFFSVSGLHLALPAAVRIPSASSPLDICKRLAPSRYSLCVLKLAAVSASHCTLVIKAILTNLFTKTLYISNIELYLANF